jgi:DMSO/TMAO reductase YedYZ molybdopterin-dependent catalytic subunit
LYVRFDVKLPQPPVAWRRGPLRAAAFSASLHDPRTATVLGRLVGVGFATCFMTGLISHLLKHPPGWLMPPSRPVWGYRLTQGVHVAVGIATAPVLTAKLWTVYPKLFAWPPVRSLRHAVERLSIAVLVAGALFELVAGYLNAIQWNPWPFAFVPAHFWVAWITVGALLLHLAVKAPVIAANWRRVREGRTAAGAARRGLLIWLAASVGLVTLTTVGQAITPLKRLDLLAPREPDDGPEDLPVNRTAAAAGVLGAARAAGWRLSVLGPRAYELSLADLRAMPQHLASLPISCVEGWSVPARWGGVRLRDLLTRAGACSAARVRVVSLERRGQHRVTELDPDYVRDPLTLLALDLNGAPLSIDHGFPARLIAPDRPGVEQTKWVTRIEVLT